VVEEHYFFIYRDAAKSHLSISGQNVRRNSRNGLFYFEFLPYCTMIKEKKGKGDKSVEFHVVFVSIIDTTNNVMVITKCTVFSTTSAITNQSCLKATEVQSMSTKLMLMELIQH
jgi:hypothetical protein